MADTKRFIQNIQQEFVPGIWITVCHENGSPFLRCNKSRTIYWHVTVYVASRINFSPGESKCYLFDPMSEQFPDYEDDDKITFENKKYQIRSDAEVKEIFGEAYPKIRHSLAKSDAEIRKIVEP